MNRFRIIFAQVLAVLYAYRMRTIVAVIGVLLGAMALVLVQNISDALQAKVAEDIKAVGDRVITVYARSPRVPGQMPRRERIKTLKLSDINAIQNINNVLQTAPSVRGALNVKYINNHVTAAVIGTDNEYIDMRGLSLADGRLFTNIEESTKEKVAIIGSEVSTDLFGTESALGKTIYLNSMTFTVIGVLKEKGADTTGNSLDNIVLIPVATALTRVFNRDYLNEILVRMRSWDDFYTISSDITQILRVEHRIMLPDRPNDFDIINPVDEQQTSNTLINVAAILGTASAGIAFFIGSVGIFSLMLLIVNQRITEIGIKRAIGATKSDILFQFLFESGYIGIIGGLSGIVLGCIISILVSYLVGLPYTISFKGIIIGLFASVASGVFAGLYPAVKASRITPVKALSL